ncbi:hypothetical protein GGI12_001355 [Dipsacomyces acuminosporus]|nr:hypothetical protein GGI12_001355 [Dipsacomyces acuminosporus]
MDTRDTLSKGEARLTDEQRVEFAKAMNIRLDPVGTSDKILIIVGFTVLGITGLLVILAWMNRAYKPIRAKNVPAITLIYLTSIIMFLGGLPTNGLVPAFGIWSHCKVWGLWIRVLPTYLFICFLTIRIAAMYTIFVLKKPFKGWPRLIPYIIAVTTILAFCITAQLVTPERTIEYVSTLEVCAWKPAFHYSLLALLGVACTVFSIYMLLIRNIRSSFNEFRESLIIYLVGISTYIELVVLHVTVKRFSLNKDIRVITTAFDIVNAANPIWVLLAVPLHKCLFHRDKYLKEWLQKLSSDGLTNEYAIQAMETHLTTASYMKMDSSGSKSTNPNHDTTRNVTALSEGRGGERERHLQSRYVYNTQVDAFSLDAVETRDGLKRIII